jgi:hypothetical protein
MNENFRHAGRAVTTRAAGVPFLLTLGTTRTVRSCPAIKRSRPPSSVH